MEIKPRQCALRYRPPTLVLLYLDRGSGKQRRRSMPLRGICDDTNIEVFANKLQEHPRHSVYIKAIPKQQLCDLLQRVKDACTGTEAGMESTTATAEQPVGSDIPNANSTPPQTLSSGTAAVSHEQEGGHEQRTQPPSSPVASQSLTLLQDLPPFTQPNTHKDDIPHLSLDDLLGPLVEEQHLDLSVPGENELLDYTDEFSSHSKKHDGDSPEEKTLSMEQLAVTDGGESGRESEPEQHQLQSLSLPIPNIVTEEISEASNDADVDLNKVSEQILAQKKRKMDSVFESHRIQPGEKDWEYDKPKDFDPPVIESGWDSESSSVEEF